VPPGRMAAWDVRRGGVMGRCKAQMGKVPFGRLVDQVMQQEPYRSAPRVCWIVDQGSSHHGEKAVRELAARYPVGGAARTPPGREALGARAGVCAE
jgi:hypothetical protein